MFRKGLVGAAIAMLSLGSAALADNAGASAPPQQNIAQPAIAPLDLTKLVNAPVILADDQPATAPTPAPAPAVSTVPSGPPEGAIMWGLDQIGIGKALESWNVSINGYVEAGYFYDFTVPHSNAPARHTPLNLILFPGDYQNSVMLNQLDLQISKTVDTTKFDIGFMVECFYGRDAAYTHSDGILDNGLKNGNTSPDNDFDLPQAYLTFAIPLGSGITITAGKFVTLMGSETINPTTNDFYTHSYEFSYGIPFTNTGILAAYKFGDFLAINAGVTRGWNQSTDDNNGAIDFLGEATLIFNDKMNLVLNLSVGPESTGDNHDYWTVPEAIFNWTLSDQLKFSADLLYGDANAIAQWYGAAAYATYTIDKYAALSLRSEFYSDGRGFTTGFGGTTINYFEATAGVAITPTPDVPLLQTLTFRPEFRVDTANHAVYDGTKFTQVTAAIDMYLKF